MRFIEVTFHCRMASPGLFPIYKGSMLRGALGASLRRGLCMTRLKDCQCCMLSANCIFPRIFSASASTVRDSKSPLLAPPFCIEPPLDQKRHYASEEMFVFSLKLFSFATDYLPFFAHAFILAGERGLGAGRERGRFYIEDIRQSGSSIFDSDNGRLLPWDTAEMPLPRLLPEDGEKLLRLRLLTPLRFKEANHLSVKLNFSTLLNLILRRMRALWALDGLSACIPEEDFAALRLEAERVRACDNRLRWHDWSRYSGRQETSMKFGGLTGEICYAGRLGKFAGFLNFATVAHIGKQTSFGLGAMDFLQDFL